MAEESTTPDLVELVRRQFEFANRADWDAALSFFAANAVWDGSPVAIGTFEGHVAIRRMWEDFTGTFKDVEFALAECRDLGNGVVLAIRSQRGRVADGGELREQGVFIYEWVDGMIVRIIDYHDIDEGRAAAERLAEERE